MKTDPQLNQFSQKNNYYLTLNRTGQYTLPSLTLITTVETKDGDLNIYQTDKTWDPLKYTQKTLIPYLQDKAQNLHGDDDYYEYFPSLLDEALILLSQLNLPTKVLEKATKAINLLYSDDDYSFL